MASKKAIFLLEQSRGASYLARAAKRLGTIVKAERNGKQKSNFFAWVLPLQNQVDKRCNISDVDLAVTVHIGRA